MEIRIQKNPIISRAAAQIMELIRSETGGMAGEDIRPDDVQGRLMTAIKFKYGNLQLFRTKGFVIIN